MKKPKVGELWYINQGDIDEGEDRWNECIIQHVDEVGVFVKLSNRGGVDGYTVDCVHAGMVDRFLSRVKPATEVR